MERIRRRFNDRQETTALAPVTIQGGTFTGWGGDAYADDIFRGAVDAIARNVSKLEPRHVVRMADGTSADGDRALNHVLQVRPNEFMSSIDFLYKMVTHLYLHNNSFAVVDRDGRRVLGIYPVDATSATFLQDGTGEVYVRFVTRGGGEFTFPYRDVIHLRRHFNDDALLGTANDAISATLELANAQTEGMRQGITSGATIRGILKFTSIMAPEKLKESRDAFMSDYMTIANTGGVIATDTKTEYQPIDSRPYAIDGEQLEQVRCKVYGYLGVSEPIVCSSFTEDQWGAFYEGTIEPLALQMSQEFTSKVFTRREQAFGNEVIFDASRMQYASTATKSQTIAALLPYGVLTLNQCLAMLNLPSVEGGDKRLQTLNVVDADRANEYQLGGER